MSEKPNSLDEVHAKYVFPAQEDIQENLEWEARQNPKREQKEIKGLESTRLKGEDEIMRYRFGQERMIREKTKDLNIEGVAVTEDKGLHTIDYTTPEGEKIHISYPEIYIS